MAHAPTTQLTLTASSVAEDLSFVGLADRAEVIAETGKARHCRLIGGHMVNLLVQRWGLELPRVTQDTDLGAFKLALQGDEIVKALELRGYERFRSNRWRRPMADLPVELAGGSADEHHAIVDLLLAPVKSYARKDITAGQVKTIEVPGLAEAVREPGYDMTLELTRLNGQERQVSVVIPTERHALVLKALSWKARRAGKDAVDIWRGLELCFAAEVEPAAFNTKDGRAAREVIKTAFASVDGEAMTKLAQERGLSEAAALERHTQIRGLALEVLGLKV